MRTEPCVCGGAIHSESADFSMVAVQLHNQSACHQLWRSRLSGEEPTAVASRDMSGLSEGASVPPLRIGYSIRRTH